MKQKREFSGSWVKLLILFVALSVVLVAPVIGFLSVMDSCVVVDTGRHLSSAQGPVYKLSFIDAFTVSVAPEQQLGRNLPKAFILAAIAFVSLTFGVVLAWMKRFSGHDSGRFFIVVFSVMSLLAADELLSIHATLGRNLRFLGDLPFVERPTEAIIWLGSLAAILFLARYRKTAFASRGALALMGIALGLLLAGALNEASKLPVEQVSGVLSSVCIIASVMVLGIAHVRTALADLTSGGPTGPSFTLFHWEGNGSDGGQPVMPVPIAAGEPR